MNLRTRFMVSGILAGLLYGAGLTATLLIPGGGNTSAQDITDFYDSDSKRTIAYLLALVLIAGCVVAIWFFNELRARLSERMLTRVGYSVAVFGLVATAVGAGVLVGPTGVQVNSDADFVGVPVAHALAQAGLGVVFGAGLYPLGVAMFLFSLAARGARAMDQWLWIVSIVLSVIMLGSFFGVPGYAFPLWLIVVGVVGLREGATG